MAGFANATATAPIHFLRKDKKTMATALARELDTSTLDEILLDLAVLIELSPCDREVADNCHRRLKVYVERPKSLWRHYLAAGQSLIYARGSVATSTTIQLGEEGKLVGWGTGV